MPSLNRHCWVIGDVHGCLQSLTQLLDALPKTDHLVFCGDVINIGPDTAPTMDLVWSLVSSGKATWLLGNHEMALLHSLIISQNHNQSPWLKRLNQLPYVFTGDGWVATHAGFNRNGLPDRTIRE